MTAHRLATEISVAGRLRPRCCQWPDENIIPPSATERRRQRQEAIYQTRVMCKHTPVGRGVHVATEWPPVPLRVRQTRPAPSSILPMPAQLAEAIEELDDVPAYAEETDVEKPSDMAFDNARRLLKAMYRTLPRPYSVYPTAGGHIAIDARGGKGRIAVVSCGSDGSVLCLASIDGNDRRARYTTARNLPDAFIREALAEL